MATYENVLIASNCGRETYDHSHGFSLSSINSSAAANIPRYAIISKVTIYLDVNHDTVFGTLGNADFTVWLCNNESDNSGTALMSGETKKDSVVHTANITSQVNTTYPFSFKTSYSTLAVYYDSTTKRLYHCDKFKIIYEYSVPTFTVTTGVETGQGTTTGDGTYTCGTNVNVTATASNGYKFFQWTDGNTDNPRVITATSSNNYVYNAVFHKIGLYVGNKPVKDIYVGDKLVKELYKGYGRLFY